MRRERNGLWILLALMALTACGGGSDVATSATQTKPESIASASSNSLVVIRYDWNRDEHPDVLTLDTSRNPLSIVEAIKGTPDGTGTNATEVWGGHEIDRGLNDALQLYLARSCSVGTETDLELIVHGTPVTVTVIE